MTRVLNTVNNERRVYINILVCVMRRKTHYEIAKEAKVI